MPSYLLARPNSDGKNFPLVEHLIIVQKNGMEILKRTTQNIGSLAGIEEQETLTIIVCGSHDIGKATKYFQDYVGPEKINTGQKKAHAPLSSLFAFYVSRKLFAGNPKNDLFSIIAALCVFAHHGQLLSPFQMAAKMNAMQRLLFKQLDSIEECVLSELEQICNRLGFPSFKEFRTNVQEVLKDFKFTQIRIDYESDGLTNFYKVADSFSTLIDADRLGAAELKVPPRKNFALAEIRNNINVIQQNGRNTATSKVSELRQFLFNAITEKADCVPLGQKLYSLTSATGSGKTLCGFFFALKLRERLQNLGIKPRILYVAPFLSIIDQNMKVFEEALGQLSNRSDIILEHHHLCEMNYNDEEQEYLTDKSSLLVEGWNSEIVATTLMQFAYTILGRGCKQLRKLHNIAGSIVILDEVQSIPAEYWNLFRSAMNFLSNSYGTTFVLMTATQPLIFAKDEILELAPPNIQEMSPDKCVIDVTSLSTATNGKMKLEKFGELILTYANSPSAQNIMVVVNTIDSASKLHDQLRAQLKSHEVFYLSAEVVPKERKERLANIILAMKENRKARRKPVLLISTQLVEAGIDLDFDRVFRDLAPIDSIIQCAGRCNRNGVRPIQDSVMTVVKVVDDLDKSFARKVYGNISIDKTEQILSDFNNESLDELAFKYYAEMSHNRDQATEEAILSGVKSLNYDKLEDFDMIEDAPRESVFIETDVRGTELFQRYIEIRSKKVRNANAEFLKIRSEFYQYVVNVAERYVAHLGDPIYGVYRVEYPRNSDFYDEKGFIRQPSGIL